jgi:CIC family chloride channel protein
MNAWAKVPEFRKLFRILELDFFRAIARRNEIALTGTAAFVGLCSGAAVSAMSMITQYMHTVLFSLPAGVRLSAMSELDRNSIITVPIIGGIIAGVIVFILQRWRKRPIVDPIEANALHGGRLSLTDSIIVAVQNIFSNGFGASVGLEAGYTQISSGIASKIGVFLQLRRADLRVLVGCGAAGAISAAFDAPLTGSFYAFELIIGSYTIMSLAPVVVSALVANIVAKTLTGNEFMIDVGNFEAVTGSDYLPAIVLGIFCAGAGILLMQGVAYIEDFARRSAVPPFLRPLIGGALIGLFGLVSPQVLSAGHGALHLSLNRPETIQTLLALLLLKSVASAISIGSGFRGGLFFASLFMGALLGKIFAFAVPHLFAGATLPVVIYAVVGMSATAVSVIGGPMTMAFLALEITGDFAITSLTFGAVIAASLTVRNTFGYSFATWRFHLRGESIKSAHDVGWIRNLTVERLMRPDVHVIGAETTLPDFRSQFPLGSAQRVVLLDDAGRYAGMVLLADVHSIAPDPGDETKTMSGFAKFRKDFLQPQMNAKQAAAIFDKSGSEALPVVSNLIEKKVIGLLTESHLLRRYSEELDRQRRTVSGEI